MRFLTLALLALLTPSLVLAGRPDNVRKTVEQSMLVTGTVSVDAEGRVSGYSLDESEKLPVGIRDFVGSSVAGWEFEPMQRNGQPAKARNHMTLRLVARNEEDGKVLIRISGATFSPVDTEDSSRVRGKEMAVPTYPELARRNGVAGTAYVALKIDRDGKVAETHVSKVDLRIIGSRKQMETWRDMLADSVGRDLKRWTFTPPSTGGQTEAASWSIMVPVAFSLTGTRKRGRTPYGKWEAYVPGPYSPAPWQITEIGNGDPSVSALANGTLYMESEDGRLKLRTALDS